MVACIAGVLVVAAEDSIDYYRYQGGYEKLLRSKPQMELFRTGSEQTGPAGFGRFMQIRLEKAPVWWPLDAALTVAAAVGWTVFRLRSFGQGEDEAGRNAPKE